MVHEYLKYSSNGPNWIPWGGSLFADPVGEFDTNISQSNQEYNYPF